jgi:hypothetical protein
MEPKEAAAVCGQAAALLIRAMTKPKSAWAVPQLAQGLSAVAARMEPKEAAAVCGQAAALLSQAMTKTADSRALPQLAQGLSAVAARMEPKEAAAVCGQAAALLSQAMTKTTDEWALQFLAQGLSAVAARMEPMEASATLIQAMSKTTDWEMLQLLAQGLSAVLHREDSWRNAFGGTVEGGWSNGSEAVRLPQSGGDQEDGRAGVAATALRQPPPPPLPAQMLVDLLKQPFCVGEARRLVLGQLARHYQRPFVGHWDFVRFAQEQELPLDLLTPPQRPKPATPNR